MGFFFGGGIFFSPGSFGSWLLWLLVAPGGFVASWLFGFWLFAFCGSFGSWLLRLLASVAPSAPVSPVAPGGFLASGFLSCSSGSSGFFGSYGSFGSCGFWLLWLLQLFFSCTILFLFAHAVKNSYYCKQTKLLLQ